MIELLVAVGITAVLAALLVPGMAKAAEKARSAKCAGNLRQLGAAFMQYAGDNDGTLPPISASGASSPSGTWYVNLLTPYIPVTTWRYSTADVYGDTAAGVYRCPSAKVIGWGGGYGVNETHLMPYYKGVKISRLAAPSKAWLIGDAWNMENAKKPTWIGVRCPLESSYGGTQEPSTRHDGRVNVCFVDGHVESWSYADLKANKDDIFCHSQIQ